MNTITVNGVKYVSEADFKAKKSNNIATKKQIVILQRGWVAIGDYAVVKGECVLSNAGIIRTWGTTKGLGELAENGMLASTKVDKCPDMRFHPMTVIARMDVNEEKWNNAY
jgi:hypothetical protein